jgi:hypothetical protein
MLDAQGDTYADFAEVLARYERKENLVMAGRVRAHLVELQASESAAERVR